MTACPPLAIYSLERRPSGFLPALITGNSQEEVTTKAREFWAVHHAKAVRDGIASGGALRPGSQHSPKLVTRAKPSKRRSINDAPLMQEPFRLHRPGARTVRAMRTGKGAAGDHAAPARRPGV